MKTKINSIYVNEKDAKGVPYISKFTNKPQKRVTITINEHGDKKLSSFVQDGSPILFWKVGEEVEIDVTQNGDFLNFSLPKPGGMKDALEQVMQDINSLKVGQKVLAEQLLDLGDQVKKLTGKDEITPDEIPF